MNNEEKMLNILLDLKKNFQAVALKAEFESEEITNEELLFLKDLSTKATLDLSAKISGCGSVRDLFELKKAKINTIIAPMIETKYSLEKFVKTAKEVFSDEKLNLIINIETKEGIKNIDDIISSADFKYIKGITLGRSDLVCSLESDDVNSAEIFDIAKNLSLKAKQNNKDFLLGGKVDDKSTPFFLNIPYLTHFETRKIVFSSSALKNKNINEGILKALEFEILYLENKKEKNPLDEKRIECLKEKIKTFAFK